MVEIPSSPALSRFHRDQYIRHNSRRLEHLASLRLDLCFKRVLEPGAGIGDHSLFYLDRGCHVTAMEPRAENCALLASHVSQFAPELSSRLRVIEADANAMEDLDESFEVVHCYGLLYHTLDPAKTLKLLAARCSSLLLLETAVSETGDRIGSVQEDASMSTQAVDGRGCRPNRHWIFAELTRLMPHVYMPRTQPAHDQFPLDWSNPPSVGLIRAVFIASRTLLQNELLSETVPTRQTLM